MGISKSLCWAPVSPSEMLGDPSSTLCGGGGGQEGLEFTRQKPKNRGGEVTCCDWYKARRSQGLTWSRPASPEPAVGQLSIRRRLEALSVPGKHFFP